MDSNDNNLKYDNEIGRYPVKVVALGGLNEMGKNCYVIEIDEDAFVIEAGMKYPPLDQPGVDMIIPDFTYLKTIAKRVKAIIISHGHDDQYGALPYLLNIVNVPVYASETTISIIKSNFVKKFHLDNYKFNVVQPSSTINIAGHTFDFFQTCHSVAQSFGFAIKTRFGNIVYTSDFMSDYSSSNAFKFDITKMVKISELDNTFLLLTESESANKTGIASPDHQVTSKIKDKFEDSIGKTFISIYNQNLFNIQEIFTLAKKYKKKICFANNEHLTYFDRLCKIGALNLDYDCVVIDEEISSISPKELVILVTGSGEHLFTFIKDICYGNNPLFRIEPNDTWINIAPSVPGTEVIATEASDAIFRSDCKVLTLSRKDLSSMHAQQEDLKMVISLFKPKYYFPVKGEFRLLVENANTALSLGLGLNHLNTFVFDNGMALAFDEMGKPNKRTILIKTGDVLIDGNTNDEIKKEAVLERQEMVNSGTVILGIAISSKNKKIVSQVDCEMKGFTYLSDNDSLVNQICNSLITLINNTFTTNGSLNIPSLEKKASERIAHFINKSTDKDPTVICKIIDIDTQDDLDIK